MFLGICMSSVSSSPADHAGMTPKPSPLSLSPYFTPIPKSNPPLSTFSSVQKPMTQLKIQVTKTTGSGRLDVMSRACSTNLISAKARVNEKTRSWPSRKRHQRRGETRLLDWDLHPISRHWSYFTTHRHSARSCMITYIAMVCCIPHY